MADILAHLNERGGGDARDCPSSTGGTLCAARNRGSRPPPAGCQAGTSRKPERHALTSTEQVAQKRRFPLSAAGRPFSQKTWRFSADQEKSAGRLKKSGTLAPFARGHPHKHPTSPPTCPPSLGRGIWCHGIPGHLRRPGGRRRRPRPEKLSGPDRREAGAQGRRRRRLSTTKPQPSERGWHDQDQPRQPSVTALVHVLSLAAERQVCAIDEAVGEIERFG